MGHWWQRLPPLCRYLTRLAGGSSRRRRVVRKLRQPGLPNKSPPMRPCPPGPRSTPRANASSSCSVDLSVAARVHRPLPDRLPPRAARPGRCRRRGPLSAPRVGPLAGHGDRGVRAPHLVREHGHGGRSNRVPTFTVWELAEGAVARWSEVTVTFWTEPTAIPPRCASWPDTSHYLPPRPRARSNSWGGGSMATSGSSASASRARRAAIACPGRLVEGDEPVESVTIAGMDRVPDGRRSRSHMLPPAMRRPSRVLFLLAALALRGSRGVGGRRGDLGRRGRTDRAREARLQRPHDPVPQPRRHRGPDYLVGLPTPKPGNVYLGVFLTIENATDTARPSATDFKVTDTLDTEYDPLESTSPYALEIGSEVPPQGTSRSWTQPPRRALARDPC